MLGVLLVHAGNRIDSSDRVPPRFPAANEVAIAGRLGELLDVLAPDGVVTSAAAGADLLLVEAALHRRVPTHLHLPCPRQSFRAASVDDHGNRWTAAFERALNLVQDDALGSLVERDLEPNQVGFLAGNQALIHHASELATTGLLAVAVRPPGGEVPPSVTDDFVRRVAQAGLFMIEIDPR